MAHDVPIGDESIRLGQFLKLASLLDSGSDAKAAIAAGEVELRRGRQLHPGDTVSIGTASARVAGP
jgi:ribosome-associated protein